LAFVFLGQMTKTAYNQDSQTKNSVETPWEESGDDDSKTKDADGEEDDKTFYVIEEQSLSTFAILRHFTNYHISRTEQVQEIVPPPPKA